MLYESFGDFDSAPTDAERNVAPSSDLLEQMWAAYAPAAPSRARYHPEYDYSAGRMVVPASVIIERIPPALLVDSFAI
jgi:hypothetical protein